MPPEKCEGRFEETADGRNYNCFYLRELGRLTLVGILNVE